LQQNAQVVKLSAHKNGKDANYTHEN